LDLKLLGQGDHTKYLHAHPRKWQSVVDGFEKIGAIGRQRNVPILLLIFPMTKEPWADYPYRNLHQQVANAAIAKNIQVLDLYDYFSRFSPEKLMVVPGDSHPSKFGHELAARAVYQWIIDNERSLSFLTHNGSEF
jgi:lysophospholipase L1-like esterase